MSATDPSGGDPQRDPGPAAGTEASARRRRLWQLGGVAGVAVIVVVVAVAALGGGGKSKRTALPPPPAAIARTPEKVPGANAVAALFAGVPQQGNALGDPRAPLTLEEFADFQCPYCRDFETGVLPDLIARFVRPGKLRIVFSPISILGPDSAAAARFAQATAAQNRFWPFTELWYDNQKTENSGYVTPSYMLRIGSGVTGLDPAAAAQASSSGSVTGALGAADARAHAARVDSTPSFLISATGQRGQPLSGGNLTPSDFDGPIQSALQQVGAG